jgi:hypothetical protein
MVKNFELGEPINEDLIVWRYMDFATFYSLLLSKAIFFRRIDKFTDENEGILPEEICNQLIEAWTDSGLFDVNDPPEMVEYFIARLRQFNTGTLSSAWVLNEKEIYAMWKIYLRGSTEGIAIKTTVGRLKTSLKNNEEDFVIAKISYSPYPWEKTSYRTLPAYKSAPYSYECELRIMIFDQFEEHTIPMEVFPKLPLYENGKTVNVELDTLIDYIYISPFAGKWFSEVVKSVLEIFIPSFDFKKLISSNIKDR